MYDRLLGIQTARYAHFDWLNLKYNRSITHAYRI